MTSRRFSFRSFHGWAALPLLAISLSACSDRTADLQMRLTALQTDLDRIKADLEAANRKEAPPAPPALPSPAEIEHNFDQAVTDLRQELQRQTGAGHVNSVTPAKPIIEEKPYHGEFSLEAVTNGRTVKVPHIPVRAGLDGKWSFPQASEVFERIRKAGEAPAATPAPGLAGRQAPGGRIPDLAAPMPSSQTVIIDWGDKAHPSAAPAKGPSPPAQKETTGDPVKVMPSSRDVHIKF